MWSGHRGHNSNSGHSAKIMKNGIQNFIIWFIHSWKIVLQSQIFNIKTWHL